MAKSKMNAPLRVMTKIGSKNRCAINEAHVMSVDEGYGEVIVTLCDGSVRSLSEDFDTVVSRLNTFCR